MVASPSFDEIFRTHAAFVWRALRYFGVRDAEIDDVCQEVFLVVHQKLATFEGRAAMRTWLYGICWRVAAAHRRKPHRDREARVDATDEAAFGAHVDPTAEVDAIDLRRALLDALEQLDEAQRLVFVLYEIEQVAMKEIAAIAECPLQTAYSRLHAARARMAELLADGGETRR